jgi:hypothetical protein
MLAERSGTFLPTVTEHHLLRAALLSDRDEVVASLEEWKARVDLNDVEYGSFRLLPLLYRNLQSLGIADDAMPRLKGILRNAWVRNQLVLEQGLSAVEALRAHGLDVLVLKGAALLADGSYAENALRPMEDLDLLVRPQDYREALRFLQAEGWRLHPESIDADWYLPFRHAAALRRGTAEIDLHWASIRDRFEGDESFWDDARSATLLGRRISILSPADQLLQTCGHASARNVDVAPIRWVADAVSLLRRHGDAIDWDRVVDVARERRLSCAVAACLRYLEQGLSVAVPPHVLLLLERDATMLDRISLRVRNSYGPIIYLYVLSVWLRLAFARPRRAIPTRLAQLPHYVRFYFRLQPDASLTRFVLSKVRARVGV